MMVEIKEKENPIQNELSNCKEEQFFKFLQVRYVWTVITKVQLFSQKAPFLWTTSIKRKQRTTQIKASISLAFRVRQLILFYQKNEKKLQETLIVSHSTFSLCF